MHRYMVYIDTIHQSKKKKKSLQGIQWQMHQVKKKIAKVVIFMQT